MITMKKILGSLLLLLNTPIFALSNATVNQTEFYPGDSITLTLNSDGNKVVFPTINNIAGHPVLSTSNAKNISIINNKRTQTTSQSYVFKPTKSVIIPTYTLTADDVQQVTQPIKITLKKPTQTRAGDDYILQIHIDKPTFFLGDTANLKAVFKIKKSLSESQIGLSALDVKDLSFIQGKQTNSADEHYNIITLNYQVSANNFGTFTIPNLVATIGNQNSDIFSDFFSRRQSTPSKKIYSNSITLKVKPLPDDLRIFGNFTIQASVDKTQVKAGEAVNVKLIIKGSGNFKDIEKFNLAIDNTTIFSDDADFNYQNWQQKFAIIGDQDFVIPSLKLDYFDKTTQQRKTIQTQSIPIQVKQGNPINPIIKTPTTKPLKKINTPPPVNDTLKYYYLLLGTIIGLLIGLLIGIVIPTLKRKKQHKHQDLIKQIKSAKGNKLLFDLLLPLNLSELKPILEQLEANLYKGATHKINKKEIITLIANTPIQK